jgi:hypothetical protein
MSAMGDLSTVAGSQLASAFISERGDPSQKV